MAIKEATKTLWANELVERSKHWPFKRQSTNGPGPNHKFGTRVVHRQDDWECECGGYECDCEGPSGEQKRVSIDPGYKQAYNAAYKAWRAGKISKETMRKKVAKAKK